AVVIADATVSRQHARIRLQDDKFMLFDLGSANGTFVNGQKVEQPRALADGDVVRFGEVEVVFRQLT
ncbi:MAG: FHA domain-containing protein, partial [Anaerolineae bacterium]